MKTPDENLVDQAFEVVAETEDWLLINKPAGISVNDETDKIGLVSVLSQTMGIKLHPVHRLDKHTSGLFLLAKNSEANAELSVQFQQQQVSKTYLALSDRKPLKKQGWIKGDMKKGRGGSWLLQRSFDNPAITHFISKSIEPKLRLFVLSPQTGKTHQLRVAMKSISAPILGDARYGGSKSDCLYLHAWRLAFDWQGERLQFEVLPLSGFWSKISALMINEIHC